MKTSVLKGKKLYLIMILLITAAGTVFFFPMNIGGKYTCFYHRIFYPSQPVSDVNALDHHQEGIEDISKFGDHNVSDLASKQDNTETLHHGSLLLDNYLHQYAFPWWASVGIFTLCMSLLLKQKKSVRGNESSLTVK
jgi:hypothetical protein